MSLLKKFGGEDELQLKENLKYGNKETEGLKDIIDYMTKVKDQNKIEIKGFNDISNIPEVFKQDGSKDSDMFLLSLNSNNEIENFTKLNVNILENSEKEITKEFLNVALNDKFAKGGILFVNTDTFSYHSELSYLLETVGYNLLDTVRIDKDDKVMSTETSTTETLKCNGFYKKIFQNLNEVKTNQKTEKEKNILNIFNEAGYKVKNYDDVVDKIKSEATPELKIIKNTIDDFLEKKLERMKYKGDLKEIVDYVRAEIGEKDYEVFKVLCLDKNNNIIKNQNLFKGTIDRSAVYPREIFKLAVQTKAHSLMFIHNHPSGNLTFSRKDMSLTQEMLDSLKHIETRLIDSVVVSRKGYKSMAEDGIAGFPKVIEKSDKIEPEIVENLEVQKKLNSEKNIAENKFQFKDLEKLTSYEEKFIKKVLERCEKGENPFQNSVVGNVYNPINNKEFKGLDALILLERSSFKNYKDSRWITFNEADSVGAYIRKGEKAVTIEKTVLREKNGELLKKDKYDKISPKDKLDFFQNNVRTDKIRIHLFNVEQVENFPQLGLTKERNIKELLKNIPSKIEEREKNQSYYSREYDSIVIPKGLSNEEKEIQLLKHFISSTSHPDRQDRKHDLLSKDYYKEEFLNLLAMELLKNNFSIYREENNVKLLQKIAQTYKDSPEEFYQLLKSGEKAGLGVLSTLDVEREDFKELKVKINFSEVNFEVKDGSTVKGIEAYNLLSKVILKDKELQIAVKDIKNIELEIEHKRFKTGKIRLELGSSEFGKHEIVSKALNHKFQSIFKDVEQN
ncbi:MAG: JAB domain-containing protein, partial [Cetobacterium sp.]